MREAGNLAGHSHIVYGVELYITPDISLHRPNEKREKSLVSVALAARIWLRPVISLHLFDIPLPSGRHDGTVKFIQP